MKNAVRYIEEHYMEKIGVTPSKYLQNYRLDKATNLVL